MDRAFSSGASGTPPSAPGSPSTGYATSGNPGTATPATKPGAWWYHMVTEELRKLIVDAGLTPDYTNTSQISQAVQALIAAGAANDYKASVRAATVGANITLAGSAPNTLDGVTLVANDRILVKDQTTGSQNGIYYVSTLGTGANGTWTRATDADGAGELTSGAIVAVEEGSANADSQWMLTTDGAITIGTTSLTFTKQGGGGGGSTGSIQWFATNSIPSGYLKANGAAISRATYSALFAVLVKTATVTMTIASPGVITWTAHGRSANDPVKFTSTGVLPTGISGGTTYYVVGASITTNTFQVSATAGGAAINTSGSQSGIHTAIHAPFGDGDGSTTFNVPDLRGEFIRGWDDSRSVDTNRAFGILQLDAFQGHKHEGLRTTFFNNGIAGGGNPTTSLPGTADGSEQATTFGTPRTATETRPRNVAMLACIKF